MNQVELAEDISKRISDHSSKGVLALYILKLG